jgi:hypothetical protein
MEKRTIAILTILSILLLVLGCSADGKKAVQTKELTPEETLAKEISGGKLVEVYDEYVRLSAGETASNWMIINNVKDTGETFTIQPCGGCQFESTIIDISVGKYKVIKFSVSASAGEQEIRVKDSRNNAYGFAKFNVIVE